MDDDDHGEKPDAATDAYMSLTHIGWEWEISNRVLGKALDEADYRMGGGMPTKKALDDGFAIKRAGGGYAWSRNLVGTFIQQRGLSERSKPISRQLFVTVPLEFS